MTPAIDPISKPDRRYLVVLVLAGIGAYFNSIGGGYIIDDPYWISNNPKIGEFFPPFLSPRVLVSWSLTLNYWLDGIKPLGYHVVNLAIHILAALALFGIVRRTLALPRWPEALRGRSDVLAFVVALLWLVHPLNTQAVTYVIQRCESMMGLFFLLTLYCVLRGATEGPSRRWYAAAVASCVLAQGCKEVAVMIPAVVLLFDWVVLCPVRGKRVRKRWGLYLGLAAGPLLAVGWNVLEGRLVGDRQGSAGFAYHNFGPWQYALTEAGVFLYYLRLALWPHPLCVDYLDWPISWSLAACYPSVLAVTGLLGATLYGIWRRSWLGLVGGWFFLILAPTSSILPIQDPLFEHRMYLPLIAVVVLVVVAADRLVERWCESRSGWGRQGHVAAGTLLAGTAAVLLGGLTIARNAQYCRPRSLYEDAVARRPDNFRVRQALAFWDLQADNVEAALQQGREAVRLNPNYLDACNIVGLCLMAKGEIDEAVDCFRYCVSGTQVLEHGGDLYLRDLGLAYLLRGEAKQAIDPLKEAVRSKPKDAETRLFLALSLDGGGRKEEAAEEFEELRRQSPAIARVLNAKARGLALAPQTSAPLRREAILLAEAACRLASETESEYLDTLAIALAAQGKFEEASARGRAALERAASAGRQDLVPELQFRLELYRKRKAYQVSTAG